MFNAGGEMGFGPKSSAQNAPPDLGRKKKDQPKSWVWGGVQPILWGTKRAADLGRNVPHTLDLGRKKISQSQGGTFREWDLGPKLKIHRFLMVFVQLIRGRSTRI